jgi:hypothetical protein
LGEGYWYGLALVGGGGRSRGRARVDKFEFFEGRVGSQDPRSR